MIRDIDTDGLLTLEREAQDLQFSQRLAEEWLRSNLNCTQTHAAQVALEVASQEIPHRPRHWRLLLLLNMNDGERVLSLLDSIPESFLRESRSVTAERQLFVEEALKSSISVADWASVHGS